MPPRPVVRNAEPRRRLGLWVGARRVVVSVLILATSTAGIVTGDSATAGAGGQQSAHTTRHCPWVTQSIQHQGTPSSLAAEVVAKMTLRQKASFVVLRTRPPLENTNDGIPSLCIRPLTLTDGPNGIAFHMRGVTQLPAAIGVAATFDPSVARATGTVMGQEAKTKGINAVQGPELNLARVPQAGRIFEAFGEDPFLTGVMGVANVEGIQSTGTMANLKHATGYTQETARYILDQKISQRALDELYNPPFQAVFASIPVASVMCSYGSINGVNDCSDPKLYTDLTSWGFSGFVRSDLGAVPRTDTASALNAGIALIKPSSTDGVLRLVRSGAVSVHSLDADVAKSLTQMFRYGLVAHPDRVRARANAITEAHTKAALTTAEESAVLLKNAGQVLPIESAPKSVAVIGTGAMDPITSGGGSSAVKAPFVSTPLSALRSSLGHATRINYAPGALRSVVLRSITTGIEVPRSSFDASPPSLHSARVESGKDDLSVVESPNVTPAAATATSPSTGRSWSSWSQTITPRSSGIYRVGLRQVGDTWLTIDGKPVISSPGLHTPTTLSADVHLTKGVPYHFAIRWFAVDFRPPPAFGIRDETPLFDAAVDAARKSRVAVVFAGEFQTEGSDRPLGLPGDLDALISAIAAVNPRTIVVVNSGGAVLMPWLSQVAAVVEDWYPGEEDGAAIAAVLTGRVDPSGRLPITFPSASVLHTRLRGQEFSRRRCHGALRNRSQHRLPALPSRPPHPPLPLRLWPQLHQLFALRTPRRSQHDRRMDRDRDRHQHRPPKRKRRHPGLSRLPAGTRRAAPAAPCL